MSFEQFEDTVGLENERKIESTLTPEEERKSFDDLIKQYGMDISGMHIPSLGKEIEMLPGQYATNGGVIIANIEGKVIAIPYNEKTIDWVRKAELQEGNTGVPALNNKETWGDREDLFRKWADVHQKFQ